MQVRFYESVDDSLLKFAVIISKYEDKWVLCKHKERDTFEVPGGRREPGESILDCARRELCEETGALEYTIEPVCVYSVTGKTRVNETGEESFGMICFANISSFGAIDSEIERIELFDRLPDSWTYPLIQPLLIKEYERRLRLSVYNVRPASETDLPFIIDVYNENIEALHGAERSFETWLEIFHNDLSRYYIVMSDSPAAWFRIDVEGDVFDLAMVQVPDVNKRKGIGRYIVENFEAMAQKESFHKLVIHTTEDNLAAKALYLSCGYEITEFDECTTADGVTRMGYTFEKSI